MVKDMIVVMVIRNKKLFDPSQTISAFVPDKQESKFTW